MFGGWLDCWKDVRRLVGWSNGFLAFGWTGLKFLAVGWTVGSIKSYLAGILMVLLDFDSINCCL